MNKTLLVALLLVAALIVAAVVYLQRTGEIDTQLPPKSEITNFEECVAAGNPVMESYPRQCVADGQNFVEEIGNEPELTDMIFVNNPRPNQLVTSPLEVTGEARGTWYFEADFPVDLYDAQGDLIVGGIAQAQDDWMTEDFVPFRATLEFDMPATDTGELVLYKDNPSGLPEYDDELRIPVNFR